MPEVVAPVEPLVPELLVLDDDEGDEDDGVTVVVELPEAPMPDVDVEPLGAETDPVAVPPVEPMPEAVPDAEPVELHAASAATHATVKRTFIMISLLFGR